MNIIKVHHSLRRQEKAFALLHELLGEEFAHLSGRAPQKVFESEFSIQELLRQLARERDAFPELMLEAAGRSVALKEWLAELGGELRDELEAMARRIEAWERRCSAQASINAEMALALVDQGQRMLDFLCKEINPRTNSTYSHKGQWRAGAKGAPLLKGRL